MCVRSWGPRPGLAHSSPALPYSPVYTVGRAMLGGKGQAEEKEAGEAGQGAGVAGVRAQIQAGWCPEDLRGGVRSLWGLAGQLLLIEAHDMVHKLVLLAGLDHAAPAQQRHTVGMRLSRDGLWEGAHPNPWSTNHLRVALSLFSLERPTLASHFPLLLLVFPCSGTDSRTETTCPTILSPGPSGHQLFLFPLYPATSCPEPGLFPSVFPSSCQPASPYLACPPAPHPVHMSVSPFCP